MALVAATIAGCSTNLLHGLDEKSANETVGALERSGVPADKAQVGGEGGGGATFVVRVARSDESRALEILRALGLPRTVRAGFAEVYRQPSLVPTASEERARYLDALSGEVERTLASAEGVVSARVHLVLEEHDPLAAEKPRVAARAAVLLKVRAGRQPLQEREVQKLVAGSVPGLDAAAVAVVTTSTAGEEPSPPLLTSFGPLRIAAGSRPLMVGLTVAGLALLALLAALLLLTGRRLAQVSRHGGIAEPPR